MNDEWHKLEEETRQEAEEFRLEWEKEQEQTNDYGIWLDKLVPDWIYQEYEFYKRRMNNDGTDE